MIGLLVIPYYSGLRCWTVGEVAFPGSESPMSSATIDLLWASVNPLSVNETRTLL